MNDLFALIASDGYLHFLFLLAIVVLVHRIFVAVKHRFTIKSRYENILICIAVAFVVLYYGVVLIGTTPHIVRTSLLRLSFTWLMVVQLYIGHMEVSRRNRAKTIVSVIQDVEGIVVNVSKPDCPEPAATIMDLIDNE